jgi:hypothetical protein
MMSSPEPAAARIWLYVRARRLVDSISWRASRVWDRYALQNVEDL